LIEADPQQISVFPVTTEGNGTSLAECGGENYGVEATDCCMRIRKLQWNKIQNHFYCEITKAAARCELTIEFFWAVNIIFARIVITSLTTLAESTVEWFAHSVQRSVHCTNTILRGPSVVFFFTIRQMALTRSFNFRHTL
jgi:hypothetical protein